MISAERGLIAYCSQSIKVPKETKRLFGFEQKLDKKRDKNCIFLGFNFRSLGLEATVITPRLYPDITVFLKFYISIHKFFE